MVIKPKCSHALATVVRPQAGTVIHWPLMGGLLHLVQRGGAWADCARAWQAYKIISAISNFCHKNWACHRKLLRTVVL